ncbi:uncharacterized protein LOC62_02G002294 [Vanrija pseudolonga]|uniref:Uncharacterized protein n=1 Tax=Vanrija pseudolonga TaxID=143232 RepID=A0AAF0Y250_9TREE|nr:hypothetical protein LOC62_02G002294 [Vanrija pseudolonga]
MLLHSIILTFTAALAAAAPAPGFQGLGVVSAPGPAPTPTPVAASAADAGGNIEARDNFKGVATAISAKSPAPTKHTRDGAVDTSPISARDYAGLSIRCFDGLDCNGNQIAEWSDINNIPNGYFYGLYFKHPGNRLASCRFDVWNNLWGTFWMAPGGTDGQNAFALQHISGENYSNGWGQYCVNQWQWSTQGSDDVVKFAAAYRH